MMDILPPQASQRQQARAVPSKRIRRTRNLGAIVLPGGAAIASLALLMSTIWLLHWTGMTPLLASLNADFVCGDTIEQLGEECDDGNRVNNDGCSALCMIENSKAAPIIRKPKVSGAFDGFLSSLFHY